MEKKNKLVFCAAIVSKEVLIGLRLSLFLVLLHPAVQNLNIKLTNLIHSGDHITSHQGCLVDKLLLNEKQGLQLFG